MSVPFGTTCGRAKATGAKSKAEAIEVKTIMLRKFDLLKLQVG
jgi:hypothetical protein